MMLASPNHAEVTPSERGKDSIRYGIPFLLPCLLLGDSLSTSKIRSIAEHNNNAIFSIPFRHSTLLSSHSPKPRSSLSPSTSQHYHVEPIQFDLYKRVVSKVSSSGGYVREMIKILMVAAAKGSQAIYERNRNYVTCT
jgi:hypothetical protein